MDGNSFFFCFCLFVCVHACVILMPQPLPPLPSSLPVPSSTSQVSSVNFFQKQ